MITCTNHNSQITNNNYHKPTQHYNNNMSYLNYEDDTSYYMDMYQRKAAVDPTIKIWKERADKRWKEKDDKWEEEYDAKIKAEKEEEERWDNLTDEQKREERPMLFDPFFTLDTDSDDSSDEESDSDSDDDIDFSFMEEKKELTPEEKKIEARKDYDEQMKEKRNKRYHEVWDEMLRCSWPQLRAYRRQFGLDNENFEADTFHLTSVWRQ